MGWGRGSQPIQETFLPIICCPAVLVPGKPVRGRESLTSLPVNNDFLLGAHSSGVSHQEGQVAPTGEEGSSGMEGTLVHGGGTRGDSPS